MSKGVLCLAVIGVLWTAPAAHAEQSPVRADSGSVAIGGSVRDSSIIIGIPSEQLEALIRDKTRDLQDLSAAQK